MSPRVITLGHGTSSRDELAALLTGAGIQRLVDVRRFPNSRANEAAGKGSVPEICTEAGIAYHWDERLGGRRRRAARGLPRGPRSDRVLRGRMEAMPPGTTSTWRWRGC